MPCKSKPTDRLVTRMSVAIGCRDPTNKASLTGCVKSPGPAGAFSFLGLGIVKHSNPLPDFRCDSEATHYHLMTTQGQRGLRK